MLADVILLPRDLRAEHLRDRAVVVFDVLRATTSMSTALSAGAREIRVFGDIAAAAAARQAFSGPALLSGEIHALPPEGFDLGNSPVAFTPALCEGRTLFVSTTNGTRAILAAQEAPAVYLGALVNASAVATVISESGFNVTLLCSGTNGEVAMEDLIGCGAVLEALIERTAVTDASDTTRIARRLFKDARPDLVGALRETSGGQNVLGAGLAHDVEFCSRLDAFDVVGRAVGQPPVVRRLGRA